MSKNKAPKLTPEQQELLNSMTDLEIELVEEMLENGTSFEVAREQVSYWTTVM